MDPLKVAQLDRCSEAGRWELGLSTVIALIVIAIALWTLAIYREATRRMMLAQRAEPAPPPTWRSREEIAARGTARVGPGDEVVDLRFSARDDSPETPRSGGPPAVRFPGP